MTGAASAARRCFILAALVTACSVGATSAAAQARDLRAERQRSLDELAYSSAADAARDRAACATGQQPGAITRIRAAGGVSLPDAADLCVTVLSRLGRDGTLGFVRDPRNPALTPALAFDNGFVTAYRRREPIPAGLPGMAALRPIAERCLAQTEPDTDLCFSAGYGYGVRAANGERVIVR